MEFECPFCNKPVDPDDQYSWQAIVGGWQRIAGVRSSGKHGGADRVMIVTGQEWAHPGCVSLAKDGVLNQESLLG